MITKLLLLSIISFNYETFINYPILNKKKNLVKMNSFTAIKDPPPPIKIEKSKKKAKYVICVVEYEKNKKLNIESWIFNLKNLYDEPNFERFIKNNAYLNGKINNIVCSEYDSIPSLNMPCIECIRFYSNGLYENGILIPTFIDQNIKKIPTAKQCLNEKFINTNITYEIMSPYCRLLIWT